MQYTILEYAPNYWDQTTNERFTVPTHSMEFLNLKKEIQEAIGKHRSISKIMRIQDIYALGQLLIREQFLLATNPGQSYYRVRRFISVNECYYEQALKYNIDYRRCGMNSLSFRSSLDVGYDSILIAVQVVTATPDASVIIPKNNLEYFIDYVIFFN